MARTGAAPMRAAFVEVAAPTDDELHALLQMSITDISGTEQHAAVRVEAHDRMRLEQLRSHNIRPALSDEWVQLNAAG